MCGFCCFGVATTPQVCYWALLLPSSFGATVDCHVMRLARNLQDTSYASTSTLDDETVFGDIY